MLLHIKRLLLEKKKYPGQPNIIKEAQLLRVLQNNQNNKMSPYPLVKKTKHPQEMDPLL